MRDETIRDLLRTAAKIGVEFTLQQFSEAAYGSSPAWQKVPKRRGRNDPRPGGRVRSAAAGILGRLGRRGVIERIDKHRYRVTPSGRAFLNGTTAQPNATPAFASPVPTSHAPPAPHMPSPISAPPLGQQVQPVHRVAPPAWVRCPEAPGGAVFFDGMGGWWFVDPHGRWWPWPPPAPF